jgi:hypothetical protein
LCNGALLWSSATLCALFINATEVAHNMFRDVRIVDHNGLNALARRNGRGG